MASPSDPRTDDELLATDDPEAFGLFYDRHARAVLGYFARRTNDPEEAADLTAETFASALVARRRYKPGRAPAGAWLYAIAARRLADFYRKGHVAARAQRALAMERVPFGDEDAELVRLLADDVTGRLLEDLPEAQRDAIRAHVVDDIAYADVARVRQVGEPVIRQRVSRGLATLRARIGGRG